MPRFPELYVLRHGQTTWNAENRLQGLLNSPLTAKGEMQAARQFEILRSRDLTGFAAVSSPQGRAIQTAGIALAGLVDTVRTDDRLCEIDVGDWSGLSRSDLPTFDGEDPLLALYNHAPGGEGLIRLRARCVDFLNHLTGPSILVTHGITSRTLRSLATVDEASTPVSVGGGQGCVYHIKDGVQNLLE
ncbi:MAG: histidine phosphatase family protein [Pseudomonadota bacterium]